MAPQTWTVWKIDENGNRTEKKGSGSMPSDPWAASVPGDTTVNGQPQAPSASQPAPSTPANSTPTTPAAAATPAPTNATPAPPPATPSSSSSSSVNTSAPTSTPETTESTPPPPPPPPPAPIVANPSPTSTPPSSNPTVGGASSISDFATPVQDANSGNGLGTTAIAMISSFLIVFVIAAVLGFVYLRKRRRSQRNTTVEAALSMRRSSSADRAQAFGFGKSSLFKTPANPKTAPPPKPIPPKSIKRNPNLTLSKIGAPVLVKATTDQEVLDAAIPAGQQQNPNLLLSQLGFESMPISPSASEFGNVPLGEMAESRPSVDHMRVTRHARDPSFDFSRIDPSASMGGISSNALIASPKTAMSRGNAKWGDAGVKASPPPFGSKRL